MTIYKISYTNISINLYWHLNKFKLFFYNGNIEVKLDQKFDLIQATYSFRQTKLEYQLQKRQTQDRNFHIYFPKKKSSHGGLGFKVGYTLELD